MRRVAVTGLGVISPIGKNAAELFKGVMSGRSGVRRFSAPFSEKLAVTVAAEADFDPLQFFTNKQIGSLDRTSQMAIAAAAEAWSDSGWPSMMKKKNSRGFTWAQDSAGLILWMRCSIDSTGKKNPE